MTFTPRALEIDLMFGISGYSLKNFKTAFQKVFPPTDAYADVEHSPDLDELKDKLKGNAFDENVWAAVFEIYQAELQASLISDGLILSKLRQNLKWVDETKKAVGCGETWPIDNRGTDNYRSQSNRRVEILFYDPDELKRFGPRKDEGDDDKNFLPCHDGTCAEEDCHIYKDVYKYNPKEGSKAPTLQWKYISLTPDGRLFDDGDCFYFSI